MLLQDGSRSRFEFAAHHIPFLKMYFKMAGGIQVFLDYEFGKVVFENRLMLSGTNPVTFSKTNTRGYRTQPDRFLYLGWTCDPQRVILCFGSDKYMRLSELCQPLAQPDK